MSIDPSTLKTEQEKVVLEALRAFGRKGGRQTMQRHGIEHMKRISVLALEARNSKRALKKQAE